MTRLLVILILCVACATNRGGDYAGGLRSTEDREALDAHAPSTCIRLFMQDTPADRQLWRVDVERITGGPVPVLLLTPNGRLPGDHYYLTVCRRYDLHEHLYGDYYVKTVEFVVESLVAGDKVIIWKSFP